MKSPELENIIEEFLDLVRRGVTVKTGEFAAAYPEHAEELQDLLPLVADMEKLNVSWADEDLPDLPGSDFKLIKKIASGGMGSIYEAEQLSLQRQVAIKILSPRLFEDEEQKQQFINESRIIAQLHHPHIIKVFDAKSSGIYNYYVMELLNGESLDKLCFSDLDKIADIGIQAAEAVAYAHSCGVLHRDIKPANLFLDKNNFLHLGDFGLSIMQQDIQLVRYQLSGTLRYMPPEKLADGSDSPQADIYALGATLFELAFHIPLFQAENPRLLKDKITSHEPEIPAGTPGEFAAILRKCLHKNPAMRYQNGNDLADDLRKYINREPVSAGKNSLCRTVRLWFKRKPAAAIWSLTAVVCALLAFSALCWGYWQSEKALASAENNAKLADLTLGKIFHRLSALPSSPENNRLLSELLPYYMQISRSGKVPQEQIYHANMIIGRSAINTGDLPLAENAFRKALSLRRNPEAANLLAYTLKQQGKIRQADNLYRQNIELYKTSNVPEEKIEAARACLELSVPEKVQAFTLLEDLLSENPEIPEYRFLYALLLGENPRLYRQNKIAGVEPNPLALLTDLVKKYPDQPEYSRALLQHVLNRMNSIQRLRWRFRGNIGDSAELSENLLWRYPNAPDIVDNVIALQLRYIELLRNSGDHMTAWKKMDRLLTVLEVFSYNPEASDAVKEALLEVQFKRVRELKERSQRMELLGKISSGLQRYNGEKKKQFQDELDVEIIYNWNSPHKMPRRFPHRF